LANEKTTKRRMTIMDERIGHWAFIVGVLLAVIAGLVAIPQSGWILAILGLVVGLLNISSKEQTGFLVAVVALIVVGAAELSLLGPLVTEILGNLVLLAAPAGLVVALKALYSMAAA
jgi:hypothetical protein